MKAGLSGESVTDEGSKPQVLLSAMAIEAALLTDRNVNESLILRLNTYATKLGLFRQAI
ncbi:hypothetical protein [Bradyrhizobium cosmicum]|uniref:hypothetical protein n=1 Tax=Bradyrhizobium cosmicum TaxID=1404864 RepID=UPI0028E73D75|nr:hypothetical protein [Bradyrhizobium cosmicum]